MRRPDRSMDQILTWIDHYHACTGTWPHKDSGRIPDSLGETWQAIHMALRNGGRSLPPGSSLARLLAEQRGVRNQINLPPLTEAQVLSWAEPTIIAPVPGRTATPARSVRRLQKLGPLWRWPCKEDTALCRAALRCPSCWRSIGACATRSSFPHYL